MIYGSTGEEETHGPSSPGWDKWRIHSLKYCRQNQKIHPRWNGSNCQKPHARTFVIAALLSTGRRGTAQACVKLALATFWEKYQRGSMALCPSCVIESHASLTPVTIIAADRSPLWCGRGRSVRFTYSVCRLLRGRFEQ